MTYRVTLILFFIIPSLLLLTSCHRLSQTYPTIDYTLSTYELTIPRGGEASIYVDISATNAGRMRFSLNFLYLPHYDYHREDPNEIQVSYPASNELLNCRYIQGPYCSYNGPVRDVDVSQFELKIYIPDGHTIGSWDISSIAKVQDLTHGGGLSLSDQVNTSLKLTVTE